MTAPATRAFEALHALSQRFEDGAIDEGMTLIDANRSQLHNCTVTMRGRCGGRAVVVQYADYDSVSIDPLAPPVYERNLLEVFVAQPRVTFEGSCRSRSAWDKFLRLFGAGGLKGDTEVFEACRIDATDQGNIACMHHRPFAEFLQQMAQQPACRRVTMQAGAGVGPLLSWDRCGRSPDAVMAWLESTAQLAATLD